MEQYEYINHWNEQREDQLYHAGIADEHIKNLDSQIITTKINRNVNGFFEGSPEVGESSTAKRNIM